MEEKLVKILNEMADYLNISQMKKLQETLLKHLAENEAKTEEIPNVEYLKMRDVLKELYSIIVLLLNICLEVLKRLSER